MVHYETRGVSPNRTFIIEFSDVPFSTLPTTNSFQIILYEGSDQIQINYLDVSSRGSGKTAAGIENSNGTIGLRYSQMDTAGIYANHYIRYIPPSENSTHTLYFPHVASETNGWETEICLINPDNTKTITGILKPYNASGTHVSSNISVSLVPHGRREITVGDEFTGADEIKYIIFEADSDEAVGYTKFYIEGQYRVAVPLVSSVNTGDVYISHIASDSKWITGIALVNTNTSSKTLTIEFDNGQTKNITLSPGEHKQFTVRTLFGGEAQDDIYSGTIKDATGIIGLELFSSTASSGNHFLSGIILKENTTTTIYYPHVLDDPVWDSGIVAYNPSISSCTLTITPYEADGTALSPQTISLAMHEKHIGTPEGLSLPSGAAWLHIGASTPITGFELFSTKDGNRLGGYTGVDISSRNGVFAKIDAEGTGIAFVNIENASASVTLAAYNDAGNLIATHTLNLNAHEKIVNVPRNLFTHDISTATYIAYSSDRNVVGFQLNTSSDIMMLDAMPGM